MRLSFRPGTTLVEVIIYTALFAFLSITLTGAAYLMQTAGRAMSLAAQRASAARTINASIAQALIPGAAVVMPAPGDTADSLSIRLPDDTTIEYTIIDGRLTRTQAGEAEPLQTDSFVSQWQVSLVGETDRPQTIAYEITFSPRSEFDRQPPLAYRAAVPVVW